MIYSLITWFKLLFKPSDPYFEYRTQLTKLTQHYILVDLNAEHYISLEDHLTDALTRFEKSSKTEEDSARLGNDIMTLRLQALAFSLRTPQGKIPFDANNLDDLKTLIGLPESKLEQAYKLIAEHSKLRRLFFEFLDETPIEPKETQGDSNIERIELDEPATNP